jgi:hypothetical protein
LAQPGGGGFRPGSGGGFAGGPGGFSADDTSLKAVLSYVKAHGGGTIGVESQSSAAAAIVSSHADIAGLGGFSGRESSVSVKWLADEIAAGRLRWVLAGSTGGMAFPGAGSGTFRVPGGDTRTGSQTAFNAVAATCPATTVSGVKLYDCQGQASSLLHAAQVSAAGTD